MLEEEHMRVNPMNRPANHFEHSNMQCGGLKASATSNELQPSRLGRQGNIGTGWMACRTRLGSDLQSSVQDSEIR